MHPAESQNVVPLMSMTTTAAPWLAADSSPWRILLALAASISVGMATAFLVAGAGT